MFLYLEIDTQLKDENGQAQALRKQVELLKERLYSLAN